MELINTNATAYDSWLSANMCSLRKAIEHLEEPNTNDIIEVTGRMIWQAAQTSVAPEGFEQAYSEIFSPIVKRPYPRLENGDYKYIEIDQGWKLWQAATAQAVPEGFVLVPVKEIKTWYLDDSENIYREDPEWLCDIPVGEVVEVEHRVSYELDQDPLFAAIQWDEENSDVGYYETFKSKAEAEKVAAHCKAMVEAQEQSHD